MSSDGTQTNLTLVPHYLNPILYVLWQTISCRPAAHRWRFWQWHVQQHFHGTRAGDGCHKRGEQGGARWPLGGASKHPPHAGRWSVTFQRAWRRMKENERDVRHITNYLYTDGSYYLKLLNRWILLSLFSIFIESPRIGGWFCLDGYWQSTVLLQDWLKSLERVLELIEEFVHPDFRP